MVTKIKDFVSSATSAILAGILVYGLCKITGITKIDLDLGQIIVVMFTWMVCVWGFQYLFDHIPELFEKKNK